MLRILIREGADPKVSGYFFKAVCQAVFLFEAETWVLTPSMESSFQHRVAPRLIGRQLGMRVGVVVGTKLRWCCQWQKRALRRLVPTSRGGRIWSRSILLRDLFWTFVNSLLGGQWPGCLGRGGIRKDWNWRRQSRDQWRSRTKRRRKARRREEHRKR